MLKKSQISIFHVCVNNRMSYWSRISEGPKSWMIWLSIPCLFCRITAYFFDVNNETRFSRVLWQIFWSREKKKKLKKKIIWSAWLSDFTWKSQATKLLWFCYGGKAHWLQIWVWVYQQFLEVYIEDFWHVFGLIIEKKKVSASWRDPRKLSWKFHGELLIECRLKKFEILNFSQLNNWWNRLESIIRTNEIFYWCLL